MANSGNEYIISGGQEGKSRLNLLSGALYPYTRTLLESHGLAKGTSLLDVGCGGGNVTLMAASIAGDTGRVTGVDFDEKIVQLAQQDAAAMDISNVSFRAASVYDIGYSNEFDMTYARFLLSHLQQPLAALEKMVQSVRPGGVVVVEDIQFSGHFCYPSCEAFDTYVQYYAKAATHNGQNAEIGPELFSLFQKAGLQEVGFDMIQPCFNEGQGKWMAWITLDRIKDTLIKQGIATVEEITRLLAELEAFTKDAQTIMSLPRIFRACGVKK